MVDHEKVIGLAKKLIKEQKLPIKILNLKEEEGGSKLILSVTTSERVDFRSLVNNLQDTLGLRVEIRPLGARECAAQLGGPGPCGLPLCCASWLTQPLNVPTKTLENLEEATSPAQVTGSCGKLLCCLLFEQEQFRLSPAAQEELAKRRADLEKARQDAEATPAAPKENSSPAGEPTQPKPPKKKRVRRLVLK